MLLPNFDIVMYISQSEMVLTSEGGTGSSRPSLDPDADRFPQQNPDSVELRCTQSTNWASPG